MQLTRTAPRGTWRAQLLVAVAGQLVQLQLAPTMSLATAAASSTLPAAGLCMPGTLATDGMPSPALGLPADRPPRLSFRLPLCGDGAGLGAPRAGSPPAAAQIQLILPRVSQRAQRTYHTTTNLSEHGPRWNVQRLACVSFLLGSGASSRSVAAQFEVMAPGHGGRTSVAWDSGQLAGAVTAAVIPAADDSGTPTLAPDTSYSWRARYWLGAPESVADTSRTPAAASPWSGPLGCCNELSFENPHCQEALGRLHRREWMEIEVFESLYVMHGLSACACRTSARLRATAACAGVRACVHRVVSPHRPQHT